MATRKILTESEEPVENLRSFSTARNDNDLSVREDSRGSKVIVNEQENIKPSGTNSKLEDRASDEVLHVAVRRRNPPRRAYAPPFPGQRSNPIRSALSTVFSDVKELSKAPMSPKKNSGR